MIGGERQPSVDTVMSTADAMEAAEAVTDSGFCTWKDMHMEGYASPLGKRKHSRDLTEPPIATAPSAEPNKKDETTDEELAECLDKILTLAYEMDRKIKEAAEDATMPGDAGRCAILTGRRARRKSAQLQQVRNCTKIPPTKTPAPPARSPTICLLLTHHMCAPGLR